MSKKTPKLDNDAVVRLIRIAGPRPDAPPDVAARAKDVVLTAWQSKVQRRVRRTRLWAAVGLTAAASLIIAIGLIVRPGGTPSTSPVASVQSIVGQAWVETADRREAPMSLQAGDPIPAEYEVATERDGRVGLNLTSGHSVRLDTDTRIAVRSASRIDLAGGAVYFDSGSEGHKDTTFEVRTPYGTVHPTGTQFEVRVADQSVRVRVRRGRVKLAGTRESHDIPAGMEVRLDQGGSASRRAFGGFGPEWTWIEQVMPIFDMEGRPARALLDWASRESGWTLEFAEDETERLASEITLAGTVDGLTVEEALTAVLPTCGMAYRVEHGALIVYQAFSAPE